MMIAARNAFLMGGGAPLPYDAEVEYLASTGVEYVDTGVSLNMMRGSAAAIEMGIAWTATNGTGYQVNGWNNNPQIGIKRGNLAYWQNFATGNQAVTQLTQYHATLDLSGARGVLRVDGFNDLTAGGDTTAEARSFLLGAMRGNNNNIVNYAEARFYWCVLRTTQMVRDFIPVRVGSGSSAVGYLYDRANPTGGPLGNGLYGNAADGQGGVTGFAQFGADK